MGFWMFSLKKDHNWEEGKEEEGKENVLIFGCSFSAGSYGIREKGSTVFYLDELISGSRGWYHYVDHFKDKNVIVKACTGQGYWSWYQILLKLNDLDKLKQYNEIWIQETIEPRPTFISDNYFRVEVIDGIKIFQKDVSDCLMLSHKSYSKNEIDDRFINDQFTKRLSKFIIKDFEDICHENDIKGFVWSIDNFSYTHTWFKRLFLAQKRSVYNQLMQNNLLAVQNEISHQTEEGNKYIGNLINTELKKWDEYEVS